MLTATSWADVSNWPQMSEEVTNSTDSAEDKMSREEPESPNISWFFEKDADSSGSLTMSELWIKYTENNW